MNTGQQDSFDTWSCIAGYGEASGTRNSRASSVVPVPTTPGSGPFSASASFFHDIPWRRPGGSEMRRTASLPLRRSTFSLVGDDDNNDGQGTPPVPIGWQRRDSGELINIAGTRSPPRISRYKSYFDDPLTKSPGSPLSRSPWKWETPRKDGAYNISVFQSTIRFISCS
jgi:hypothetical protein